VISTVIVTQSFLQVQFVDVDLLSPACLDFVGDFFISSQAVLMFLPWAGVFLACCIRALTGLVIFYGCGFSAGLCVRLVAKKLVAD